MKKRAKPTQLLLALFMITALPMTISAAVPEVSHIMVTDVTTVSFSVIWAAGEASSAGLQVFEDEAGTIPVADAIISPHPVESGDASIKEAAENNGVMKVRVTGLEFATTYYFQTITTSKSTSDVALSPETAPFMAVSTEALTVRSKASGGNSVPFSNDVIVADCYLDDDVTPADGTLLLASIGGGNYPVTAFVGDGIAPPKALIDLNNIYGRNDNENMDVAQGTSLTLLNFRGISGKSIITHKVPADTGLCEIKPPAPALLEGWNLVSFPLEPQDPDTETVLAPIWDKFSSIWTYDTLEDKWYRYDRFGPPFLNNLNEVHSLGGYWIVMDSEASLKIHGEFPTDNIPIHANWNLVGYKSIESWELPGVADSIASVLECIWTYETELDRWKRYCPNGPPFLNNLSWIEPGKAYWVDATGVGEW
jgi:hypothetical protein